MKTVAISQAVYDPPSPNLGFRVLGPDSAHSFATFTIRERIETAVFRVDVQASVTASAGPNSAAEDAWFRHKALWHQDR